MSALKPVVIMGGLGSGQIVASVIEDINAREPAWELRGYLNDVEEIGARIGAYPVVGRTAEAPDFAAKGVMVHYAMRNAKFARPRIARFRDMGIPDEAFATFVHPSTQTSGAEGLGHGSLLCAQVNLSFGAVVANHNHLYGNAFVGHDSRLEDFSWIANNAAIGARCVIGEGAHLGTNCSLREDVSIGAYAIVGIGSVILKDVPENGIAVGNPAKIIGSVERYTDDPSDPEKAS